MVAALNLGAAPRRHISESGLSLDEESKEEYRAKYFGAYDPFALDKDAERAKYKAKVVKLYKSQVPENLDLTAERAECVWHLPAFVKPWILPIITDERDYIQVELLVNVTVGVMPALIFFCLYPSHLLGVALLVYRLLTYADRFMLTLHVGAHRKLFVEKYWFMNSYAETVGAFMFGMPPGFYYIHHIQMHHVENNVFPYDISSTMPHQRDSWLSLAHYISKYFTHAVFYLPYYAFMKRRYKLLAYHLTFWVSYFIGSAWLALSKGYTLQVLWLVYIPFIVLGCAIMQGNYAQHIFVCPDDPFNNYRLSFNYLNDHDNQITYNDGYHIIHHSNSRLHWSNVPQWFEDNIELFAENDALVFKNIHNGGVFSLVMKGDYKTLFKHYVQLQPNNIRTEEEFEALCRKRLVPIHKVNKPSLNAQKDKDK